MKTRYETKLLDGILVMGCLFLMLLFIVGNESVTAYAEDKDLYFDNDGNLYYHTRDKKASGSVRYKTIGWIIKRHDMPIDAPEQQYVIVTKQNYKPDEPDPENSKYVLCYFKSDKDEILNAVKTVSEEWYNILTGYGDDVYIDSVMTVVEGGKDMGTLYVGGQYTGEVYMTYEEIAGARSWASPESLRVYYDIKVAFPQIVKEWTSYAEIISREEVLINTSVYSSFLLGANTYGGEKYDVSKGIPSGEALYIKGATDATQCSLQLSYVHARLHECVSVPVTYLIRWKDYYGEINYEIRVIQRYYDVTRDFYYYEFGDMDIYQLNGIKVAGQAFEAGSLKELSVDEDTDIVWDTMTYGDALSHIDNYTVNHTSSLTTVLLEGTDGKKPIIPDTDYSADADMMVGELYVRNDLVTINGAVVLNNDVSLTEGSKPMNVCLTRMEEIYSEGLLIGKSTLNGVYEDCCVELIYENENGETISYEDELNYISVHTPVFCEVSAFSQKSMNQAVKPLVNDVVLGEEMTIFFNDFGMHRDIKGYGLGSYVKYVGARQICCPFDVIYKGVRYEADTWINVDGYNVKVLVCEENKQGNYVIYARTQAYNGLSDMANKSIEERANLAISSYGAWDVAEVRLIGKIEKLNITLDEVIYYAPSLPLEIGAEDGKAFELAFETVGDMKEQDYVEIEYTYYHEGEDGLLTPVDVYGVKDRNYIDGILADKFVDKEKLTALSGGNRILWTTEHQLYDELLAVPVGTTVEELKTAIDKDDISKLCLKGGHILVCVDIVSYRDNISYLSYINEDNGKKGYCNKWLYEGGVERYPYGAVLRIVIGDEGYYDYEVSGTH